MSTQQTSWHVGVYWESLSTARGEKANSKQGIISLTFWSRAFRQCIIQTTPNYHLPQCPSKKKGPQVYKAAVECCHIRWEVLSKADLCTWVRNTPQKCDSRGHCYTVKHHETMKFWGFGYAMSGTCGEKPFNSPCHVTNYLQMFSDVLCTCKESLKTWANPELFQRSR